MATEASISATSKSILVIFQAVTLSTRLDRFSRRPTLIRNDFLARLFIEKRNESSGGIARKKWTVLERNPSRIWRKVDFRWGKIPKRRNGNVFSFFRCRRVGYMTNKRLKYILRRLTLKFETVALRAAATTSRRKCSPGPDSPPSSAPPCTHPWHVTNCEKSRCGRSRNFSFPTFLVRCHDICDKYDLAKLLPFKWLCQPANAIDTSLVETRPQPNLINCQ